MGVDKYMPAVVGFTAGFLVASQWSKITKVAGRAGEWAEDTVAGFLPKAEKGKKGKKIAEAVDVAQG